MRNHSLRRLVVVAPLALGITAITVPPAAALWSHGSASTGQQIASGSFAGSFTSITAAVTGNHVKVTWGGTVTFTSHVVGYDVYRYASTKTSVDGTGSLVCTATAPTLNCTDSTGTPGTSYKYSVRPTVGTANQWIGIEYGLSSAVMYPAH